MCLYYHFVVVGILFLYRFRHLSAACTSENKQCSNWAAGGECYHNPAYMVIYCSESCNTAYSCGGQTQDTNSMCWSKAQNGQCETKTNVRTKSCLTTCKTRSEVTCDTPPNIPHAHFNTKQTYRFMDRVKYSCDVGYEDNSVRTGNRVCTEHGVWIPRKAEGEFPICKIISCGQPPVLKNTTRAYDGTLYKAVATYECIEGYVPVGGDYQKTCSDKKVWTGADLLCEETLPVISSRPDTNSMSPTAAFSSEGSRYFLASVDAIPSSSVWTPLSTVELLTSTEMAHSQWMTDSVSSTLEEHTSSPELAVASALSEQYSKWTTLSTELIQYSVSVGVSFILDQSPSPNKNEPIILSEESAAFETGKPILSLNSKHEHFCHSGVGPTNTETIEDVSVTYLSPHRQVQTTLLFPNSAQNLDIWSSTDFASSPGVLQPSIIINVESYENSWASGTASLSRTTINTNSAPETMYISSIGQNTLSGTKDMYRFSFVVESSVSVISTTHSKPKCKCPCSASQKLQSIPFSSMTFEAIMNMTPSVKKFSPKPVEAEGAKYVGVSAILLLACSFGGILLLDFVTVVRHFNILRFNLNCISGDETLTENELWTK